MQQHKHRYGDPYGLSQSPPRFSTSSGELATIPCQLEKIYITGMSLMTPDAQTAQTQWKIHSMLYCTAKVCKRYGKLPRGDVV